MKVIVLDDWEHHFDHSDALNKLKARFEVEVFHDRPDKEALTSRLKEADVVIPIRERTIFSKDILDHMRHVQLLAQTGSGVAHIDLDYATQLKIPVVTTPGGSSAVVELVFGYLIAFFRELLPLDRKLRQGYWPDSVGLSLENKTIGIIGLGQIGSRVAALAKAFNMNVVAWGPRLKKDRCEKLGVRYVPLENLLKESDVVTLHVRLAPDTTHLLKEEHFKWMRPSAFLINTSRGKVIDEQALIQALKTKQISGAGLDVFVEEPLPLGHPFLTMENVILTPHIGWKTDQMFHNFLNIAADLTLAFFEGHPERLLNPEILGAK